MARELLLDTYGKTDAITGMDQKLVRNPSLWRSVGEDSTDLFSVIANVYKTTGNVYERPTNSSTESHAYIAIHVADKQTMNSMNAVMMSPEFSAIIESGEMDSKRKVFETQILARRQAFLDGLSLKPRK